MKQVVGPVDITQIRPEQDSEVVRYIYGAQARMLDHENWFYES